ncbi:MAG TPA: hypothetical protein VKA83_23320 [Methylomirabilota bacterium]|nr:hypothetical protein [Methylomirabilota bacterium]
MNGPSQAQHRRMHALWRNAGVESRADRLALTGAIVGRQLASSNELTALEALDVVDYLTRLDRAGELAARAAAYLAEHRPVEPAAPDPAPVFEADGGEFALFVVEPVAAPRPRWDL